MFDGNKRLYLAFLLFGVIAFSGFSQADYKPGYLLLTKNDTLFGLIDNNSDDSNSKICRFRKSENEQVQEFFPKTIIGYKIIDGKYYLSKDVLVGTQAESRFLECLVEGTLSLYFYRSGFEDHYLLEKAELPLKEISFPDNIIYVNNVAQKRESLINRALVRYYMQDYPEMGRDIDQIKVPSHSSLIKLVKKYLEVKCPNEVCLIYEKKKNKFRMDIQPVFGVITYSNSVSTKSYSSCECGLLTYFWMPLSNEKMFFKSGVLFSSVTEKIYDNNLKFNDIDYKIYKIPFQLQYIFLKHRITPTFGGGMNLLIINRDSPMMFLPSLNVGLNTKVSNRFYVSLFSECDFNIFPSQIVSYSFNLGLTYRL